MHRALFGLQELAELFGVSKQTFSQRFKQNYWRYGFPRVKFPDPAYTISAGRFWTWEQLDEFVRDRSRVHPLTWKEIKELEAARKRLDEIGQVTIEEVIKERESNGR